jgi:peptidyl-prolyl cis-trans isomerase SurA
MFKKKKILLFLGLIILIFNSNSNSLENKILVKIENQIITSIDVNNEYKYLVALNPSIKNSKKKRYPQTFKKIYFARKNKKN